MTIPDYFEFACPVKIVSGHTALPNIPHEMGLLGARRALVVTDRGVEEAGLVKLVTGVFAGDDRSLGGVFSDVPPDSSDEVAARVVRAYREGGCDCLLAVGGGSVIDTAKAANMLLGTGAKGLLELQGAERLQGRMPPFIVVPTTAGTGSEVTMAAVIANTAKRTKMAFIAYNLFPDVAILDPKMTLSMPPMITAATGMDALTHACEAYYCLQKNPLSDAFAVAAIDLLMEHLVPVVRDGSQAASRLAMANAALMAGIAFSSSLVGVIHALAHAVGAVAHVPHGVANAILLPWGMEYNIPKRASEIAALAPHLRVKSLTGEPSRDAAAAVQAVRNLTSSLNQLCGLPRTLKQAGVTRAQLEEIAATAIDDGAIAMNPEEVDFDDALTLLIRAY